MHAALGRWGGVREAAAASRRSDCRATSPDPFAWDGTPLALSGTHGRIVVLGGRSSEILRQHFGPEYDETIRRAGSRARAEAELEGREKRVKQLDIRALSEREFDGFTQRWRAVQALFVESPIAAVAEAELLIKEVMRTRGYPMGDFDARASDISVDHPLVVSHYRAARGTALASQRGQATTEDLRQALVHYRALVEDLLETSERVPMHHPVR